jgi:hypothetical protein
MKAILLFVFFVAASFHLNAQAKQNSIDNFIGKWKGTSICQVKNSPCHDEIVVYYITKGKTTDSYQIDGYKIVNGVEEEMGIIPFVYDKTTNEISSTAYNSNWNFKLVKGKMEGTLMHKGQLYRIINVTKE